jgi:hypothetical protein
MRTVCAAALLLCVFTYPSVQIKLSLRERILLGIKFVAVDCKKRAKSAYWFMWLQTVHKSGLVRPQRHDFVVTILFDAPKSCARHLRGTRARWISSWVFISSHVSSVITQQWRPYPLSAWQTSELFSPYRQDFATVRNWNSRKPSSELSPVLPCELLQGALCKREHVILHNTVTHEWRNATPPRHRLHTAQREERSAALYNKPVDNIKYRSREDIIYLKYTSISYIFPGSQTCQFGEA